MRTEAIQKMLSGDAERKSITVLYQTLVEQLCKSHGAFKEQGMVVSSVQVGTQYTGGLMVVGRAVNDWHNYFEIGDTESAWNASLGVLDELKTRNLDWVKEAWGTKSGGYNTKKSAFWRVAVRVSEALFNSDDWSIDRIAYSNLYKVAPEGGGNPSDRLCDAQFASVKEILDVEIAALNPKVVLCSTGWNWASPFFEGYQALMSDYPFRIIEAVLKKDNTLVIVAPHPQGKDEELICSEVQKVREMITSD
jgi:hypothetical protein